MGVADVDFARLDSIRTAMPIESHRRYESSNIKHHFIALKPKVIPFPYRKDVVDVVVKDGKMQNVVSPARQSSL